MNIEKCLKIGKPFTVAEIGQNHNGDMNIAKELINRASDSGFDAVKFVKRDIKSELTEEAYNRVYDNPNSFGKTYGEHREYLEFDVRQHKELKRYSEKRNLVYFCSVCDIQSMNDMKTVGIQIYKIASRDLTNLPLLEEIAKLNKIMIISTGMASYQEIDEAIELIRKYHNKIILLQCTSQYPTPMENINLRVIPKLREKYGVPVGLSDHNPGILPATLSVVFQAAVIEKHITLSRAMKGTDHSGSLEFLGMRKLITYIENAQKALGTDEKYYLEDVEEARKKLERSIVSKIHITKGTKIRETMLILKSPGVGLKWRERSKIVGKKAKVDIKPNTIISIDDVERE